MSQAINILGTESLGVRGLSCVIKSGSRKIIIDPGLALGYIKHGQLPHPCQIYVGERVRLNIINALNDATDVIFSHFHGDHIPLRNANPYQLALSSLPDQCHSLRTWFKSPDEFGEKMKQRALDLRTYFSILPQNAEGKNDGPISFSPAMPHGERHSRQGSVLMTRVDLGDKVFVHASDIQMLDAETIDFIIAWKPDIVLAAGPPLYLETLTEQQRSTAWVNSLKLSGNVEVLILDHHLLRDLQGIKWLKALSSASGRQIYCAADFMRKQRLLLEARRSELYDSIPVPKEWHEKYANGTVDTKSFSKLI